MKTVLYKHQKNLLKKNPKKWLLAWECGSGKTLGMLELMKSHTNNFCVITIKSDVDKWKELTQNVYSKETFRRDWNILPKYDGIIIDEVHAFSGYTSAMHKNMLKYIKKNDPEFVIAGTATPYLSTPWNIYALAKILGKDWNWFKFKKHFFYEVKMGHRMIPMVKKGIEGQIAELVNKLGNTVRMDECVDVPKQIFQTEYFALTREQKNAIENLDDILPIVRWTKVHQICGGTLKGDEYSEPQTFKSDKLSRVLELIEQHKKLIIVCRYNYEIEYIKKQIKKKTNIFTITGATKDRHAVVKSADRSDEAVVLANAACSEGYELPSFPIMVFYSYDFSLKNYLQIIGRIQRLNHIKKNVYLSLLVKDSIDEDVYKCVIRKQNFDIEIYDKN